MAVSLFGAYLRAASVAALCWKALAMHIREEQPANADRNVRPLPNIVLILADTVRPEFIGAYGNRAFARYGVTPNLDKLASEGAVFKQAFAAAPLSAPSRFSIVTGHYNCRKSMAGERNSSSQFRPPQSKLTRVEGSENVVYEVPASGMLPHAVAKYYRNRTIAARLRQEGYVTGGIGKWHLGAQIHNEAFNFSYLMAGSPEDSSAWGISTTSAIQNPEEITWQAEKFVRTAVKAGKPFFLHVAHSIPHGGYNMTRMLNEDPGRGQEPFLDMSVPRNEHGIRMLELNTRQREFIRKSRGELRDALEMRGFMKNAFKNNTGHARSLGALMWLDQQVGQLLQGLHRADVLDDTLVIFTADHGAINPKGTGTDSPLNLGSRVPLIVRWTSGGVVPGIQVQEPVSLVDLMPTVLHAGRTPYGNDLDGQNLLPAICGSVGAWHGHPDATEGRYPGDILDRLHSRPVWLESGKKRALVQEGLGK